MATRVSWLSTLKAPTAKCSLRLRAMRSRARRTFSSIFPPRVRTIRLRTLPASAVPGRGSKRWRQYVDDRGTVEPVVSQVRQSLVDSVKGVSLGGGAYADALGEGEELPAIRSGVGGHAAQGTFLEQVPLV